MGGSTLFDNKAKKDEKALKSAPKSFENVILRVSPLIDGTRWDLIGLRHRFC